MSHALMKKVASSFPRNSAKSSLPALSLLKVKSDASMYFQQVNLQRSLKRCDKRLLQQRALAITSA